MYYHFHHCDICVCVDAKQLKSVKLSDSSRLILLVLYIGLSMMGTNFHSALREQEMSMTDTSQVENSLDEHYMDARTRMGFEYLLLINPYGQATYESMPIFESHGEYLPMQILKNPFPKIFLFSAVESIGITAAGILSFRKKAIK